MNKYLILVITLLFAYSCSNTGGANTEKETDTGFKYTVIKSGKSDVLPKPDELVEFNFTGYDLEGNEVVSSQDMGKPGVIVVPIEGGNSGPVNPMEEVLSELVVGDSVKMEVTPKMFNNQIQDTQIYHMGVIEIMDKDYYMDRENAKKDEFKKIAAAKGLEVAALYENLNTPEMQEQIQTTDTGLKYVVLEKGDGPKPVAGETVKVDYYGILSKNGEMFDNSYQRGTPYAFPLGQGKVIPGWDQGIALLNKGTKALLIIPSDLAYGDSGSGKILPGDELIFHIELQK